MASAPSGRSSFDLLQREFRQVEMQDPPLHQPSAQRPRPTTMLDIPSEPCSLTIHTVQLSQHARRLRGLIAAAQQGQQPLSTLLDAQGVFKPEDGMLYLPGLPHQLYLMICFHWIVKLLDSHSNYAIVTQRATSTSMSIDHHASWSLFVLSISNLFKNT